MSRNTESARLIRAEELDRRRAYRLMTTLVVPRPIGWLSSRGGDGTPNLAPYSYFNAVSAHPPMVMASVGHRPDGPKDALVTIRETGVFCVNIVTEKHLEAMVQTSGDYPPGADEFAAAGLTMAEADTVPAPYVADAPAVLECRLFRDVDLGDAPNTLVIGSVQAFRLGPELDYDPDRLAVTPGSLRPVGRLGGDRYTFLGEIRHVPRPRIERRP